MRYLFSTFLTSLLIVTVLGSIVAIAASALPGFGGGDVAEATEKSYSADSPVKPSGPVLDSDIRTVQGIDVHREIADDVDALLTAARADGVVLSGWGWRSHQRQHELRKINGCPDGWTHTANENPANWSPSSSCATPTARPGSSNHETGFAIDFTYGGSVIGSRNSVAFRWLNTNAIRYGLKNLPSEPWHWSIDGR